MVVVLLIRATLQLHLLFIQWPHCSSRELVQVFPTFTHLQHRQLRLSLHRQQSYTGWQHRRRNRSSWRGHGRYTFSSINPSFENTSLKFSHTHTQLVSYQRLPQRTYFEMVAIATATHLQKRVLHSAEMEV